MGLPTIAVPQYTLQLPSSGKEIKYRPFLVKEEKILLLAMESEDKDQILNATKQIITNCVFGDIDADDLPTFDMEYIFLQLRSRAKGEIIELTYKCPKCKGEIPVNINIDDIKVVKQEKHTDNIKLTEDLGVMMKYPNMSLQMEIANSKGKEVDNLFTTIISCIDCIYDKENTYPSKDHTQKELLEFIESLTDPQFQQLADFFATAPALKHNLELNCKNKDGKKTCTYKESKVLEGLNSFFT